MGPDKLPMYGMPGVCYELICKNIIWCTQGKRVIVFVVGGITHSEMRVAHNLSKKLGRDIVIGGTSLDSPKDFLANLLVSSLS